MSTRTENLLVSDAAFMITQSAKRLCAPNSLRKAARRIGVLEIDDRGRSTIPRAAAEKMAKTFREVGYLIPRDLPMEGGSK
jgi:hypothetical protein